jgi:hypothetical protein
MKWSETRSEYVAFKPADRKGVMEYDKPVLTL